MASHTAPAIADDETVAGTSAGPVHVQESGVPTTLPRRRPRRRWYRLALASTLLLVLAVVSMLPFAIRSMQEVLGRDSEPLYDLVTGQVVSQATIATAQADTVYLNIGLVDLDETTGQLTLALSGNRQCTADCWNNVMTFVALDDDADQRRGLPPSATLTLAPDERVYSKTMQLPVRGQSSLYPFDSYQLWLGVAGESTTPDGQRVELNPATMAQRQAVMTIQNRLPDMLMPPPTPIASAMVRSASDPFSFAAVQALSLQRPLYLKVLAVVLTVLIAISAALAIFTRGIEDLALGVGGLILGVWGIREVLMPQSLGTVTVIDLALSWLIMLLLLGLAVRAALHFHRHSELPWPPTRRPS